MTFRFFGSIVPFSIVLTLVGIFLPAAPAQAGCGCAVIPNAGVYSGPETFTLSHSAIGPEGCPTALTLTGKRQNAPALNVTLTCDGSGTWVGSEPSPFQAPFKYRLHTDGFVQAVATHEKLSVDLLDAGVRSVDTVTLEMILPPMMKKMGKADRRAEFSIKGGGQAPACICNSVREELQHVKDMQANYANQKLIQKAEIELTRGTSSQANFWMDETGRMYFMQRNLSQITYEDQVTALGTGEPAVPKKIKHHRGLTAPDEYELGEGSAAKTIAATCEIIMPKAESVRAECMPLPVLQSSFLHEKVHADRCEMLNSISFYKFSDGTTIDLTAEKPFQGYFRFLKPVGLHGYINWSQNPRHHSRDEIEAYQAEIDYLSGWLTGNCPA